jgi:ABC-type amino acid transport substrate-binding protein
MASLERAVSGDRLFLFASFPELLRAVIHRQVDVGIWDFPIEKDVVERVPEARGLHAIPWKFDPAYPELTARGPAYFAFHREAIHLRAAATIALDVMKLSGELTAILEKYGYAQVELLRLP